MTDVQISQSCPLFPKLSLLDAKSFDLARWGDFDDGVRDENLHRACTWFFRARARLSPSKTCKDALHSRQNRQKECIDAVLDITFACSDIVSLMSDRIWGLPWSKIMSMPIFVLVALQSFCLGTKYSDKKCVCVLSVTLRKSSIPIDWVWSIFNRESKDEIADNRALARKNCCILGRIEAQDRRLVIKICPSSKLKTFRIQEADFWKERTWLTRNASAMKLFLRKVPWVTTLYVGGESCVPFWMATKNLVLRLVINVLNKSDNAYCKPTGIRLAVGLFIHCQHYTAMMLAFSPVIFVPNVRPFNWHFQRQCIALEPEIRWKRWFAWAFQRLFYNIFTLTWMMNLKISKSPH